jgi:hypothetical protein
MELANTLAKSSLVPKAFAGRPADILLAMMAGKELGFSTVQSFRSLYVLNGKVALYADAMVGICVGKPQCEYFRLVSSDEKEATYEAMRKGSQPVKLTYTMEQAKRAGLTGNATYQKHAEAMLRARCASALARIVFPDFLAGLYDPSELEVADETPEVKPFSPPRITIPASPPPNPFATDAEFSPVDPGAEVKDKEASLREAKFPSGSMKGQYLEAAPLSMLQQVLDHVSKAPSKTTKDLQFAEALTWWIARKSAADDFTEDEVRKAQRELDAAVFDAGAVKP